MKKILILLLIPLILYAELPDGNKILEMIDKNYQAKTRISTSVIIIKGRRTTRELKVKTWARGSKEVLSEYLSPPREKGTKMLKIDKELWIWSPASDRIIKIAGHMLKQSMMGSDVSYEDFMEDPDLSKNYDVKVTGEEKINQRDTYILELTAKNDREVSYYKRNLWVDKERYLPLKEELYARTGKLLKKFEINEVFKVGERWYPKKIIFKDMLQAGDGTQILVETVEFDKEIPDYIFSKASLKK